VEPAASDRVAGRTLKSLGARGIDVGARAHDRRDCHALGDAKPSHEPLGKGPARIRGFVIGDGREVVLCGQIAIEMRVDLPPVTADVRAGGRAGREPLVLAPIGEVVAACLSGACKVADLVSRESGGVERPQAVFLHLGGDFIARGHDSAHVPLLRDRGTGLEGEAVAGEVIRVEGEGASKVGVPRLARLARYGEDQIERRAPDAGAAGELDGPANVVGIVPSFEHSQQVGIERLGPDADPVDRARRQQREELGGRGLRVAFDGELEIGTEVKRPADGREDAIPVGDLEQGRGAASDEDRFKRPAAPSGVPGGEGVDFAFEAGGEGGLASA